ncbi:MAG: indolepyruvate oxidoreductase subunit beta family protein [Alphaproteobacteria bacterium]|nr:indolepyruvate oxidoreductase subunit beta family protein [Alphaproteobacteria bacterium]
MAEEKAIKIAINALGGQGGGVLSQWLVTLGELSSYIVQSTSVPGVAQRTGATVYYVELFPAALAEQKKKPPVLALMPAPGDVDIVIAAELMEAGRAITRGFVTKQTTLISSSHRVYAIGEKINMGDGRQSGESVIAAAKKSAGRLIISDMDALAASAGAVISAVLFGALAGSGALPIARDKFEAAIRASGRAIERNLAGFNAGYDAASSSMKPVVAPSTITPTKKTSADAVKPLLEALDKFPVSAHFMTLEGLKKVVDFQDVAYGDLYLERLQRIQQLDESHGGGRCDWALLKAVAKHLALWMAYDDIVRVADLKTRATRFQRVREDIKVSDGQISHVSEYMHPRAEEVCDLLPAWLAKTILNGKASRKILERLLGEGRRVSTTKLRGFLMLNMLASLRFMRRKSYRYEIEQQRITNWLERIKGAASEDYSLACELAGLQCLIKGYGDTHARGVRNLNDIMSAFESVRALPNAAVRLRELRDAALKDEGGVALKAVIMNLKQIASAA